MPYLYFSKLYLMHVCRNFRENLYFITGVRIYCSTTKSVVAVVFNRF